MENVKLNKDCKNLLDYLRSQFEFLENEFFLSLHESFNYISSTYLIYHSIKCNRAISIEFSVLWYGTDKFKYKYEITIEKNRNGKIIINDWIVLDTKYLDIKEYSKEITDNTLDMKAIKDEFSKSEDYFYKIINKETECYKTIMTSYLKELLLCNEWTNYPKIRKKNIRKSK